MNVKENAKNVDTWLRGLFIIIFAVIFYVLYIVIWVVVVIQFFTKVLTGSLNEYLSSTSCSLTDYATQILRYITFQSELRPFPFSPWPEQKSDDFQETGTDTDESETNTLPNTRQDNKEG